VADLDCNPKNLYQAYDMGFCDGALVRESAATELIRLRAQQSDRCERCELHQAVADLIAMERSRNIWRFAAFGLALVLFIPALIALAEWL
jgi:hypothetical protein